MKRALKLAQKGKGRVSPNPLVGAVFVKNDRIIGEGYHECCGQNHAEINAIKNASEEVRNSTLYINLEPCCHYGRTPPCVNTLVDSGIKKVVISNRDPNKIVNGKGIAFLRERGVEVIEGVLEKEGKRINRFYFKFVKTGIPYVIMKAAQTINAIITDSTGYEKWITSMESRKEVHRMRNEVDAILIGNITATTDDPELTVRHIQGKDPLRIILDPCLETSPDLKVYNDKNVIIFTNSTVDKNKTEKFAVKGIEIIQIENTGNNRLPVAKVLEIIGKRYITSVLVEGGSQIFSSFLHADALDEMVLFVAPKIYSGGLFTFNMDILSKNSKPVRFSFGGIKKSGPDLMIRCFPDRNEGS